MITKGDKVGIVCCSNAQLNSYKAKNKILLDILKDMELEPVCSDYIYETYSVFSGTGEERGLALMDMYKDKNIKAIFDISGGDVANELLSSIDYEIIKSNPKPFFGYSDLTTIINAIYTKTGNVSYLYQIKNFIRENNKKQMNDFRNTIMGNSNDLFNIQYEFLQGSKMQGVVIGGNIRCFLKLAGTAYLPDVRNKILFLESLGGEVALMTTYLNQLKQMNIFEKIAGILLGTFTSMEENNCTPTMEELIRIVINNDELPIAKTYDIGHGGNSKCLIIGKVMEF